MNRIVRRLVFSEKSTTVTPAHAGIRVTQYSPNFKDTDYTDRLFFTAAKATPLTPAHFVTAAADTDDFQWGLPQPQQQSPAYEPRPQSPLYEPESPSYQPAEYDPENPSM